LAKNSIFLPCPAAAGRQKQTFLYIFLIANDMAKYFLYARKSTDEEERQVLSIEAQLAELREFAAKEKLEIVLSTPVQESNPRRFIMFPINGGDLCAHRTGGESTLPILYLAALY